MAKKSRKPAIGKPMAVKKITRNRKPAGPARTAKTAVTGQRCERIDDRPCPRAAVAFRQGQHVCREHTPTGDPYCTHSLSSPEYGCPWCGHPPKETS